MPRLRRPYFVRRIRDDLRSGIDRQPLISHDISLNEVHPPNLPPDIIVRQPPLITTTGGGFEKVSPPAIGGVGGVGGVELEAKGKKFSIYIIIGAVIIVGIISMRR